MFLGPIQGGRSRPPHSFLKQVLPSLLEKKLVIGRFSDYPSQGEAEEASALLTNLGLEVKTGPASGRALKDQVWWNRFVVIAGTDTFDPASLQNNMSGTTTNFDTSWCTNDKNVPSSSWKIEKPTLKPSIRGSLQVANPSGFVQVNTQNLLVWDTSKPLPGLHSGSWLENGKDPLLLLSSDRTRCRTISPEETAILLGTPRLEAKTDPPESASKALASVPRSLARLYSEIVSRITSPPDKDYNRVGVCSLPHEDECDATWMYFLTTEDGLPSTPFTAGHPPHPIGHWSPNTVASQAPGPSLARARLSPSKFHGEPPLEA